MPIFFREFQPPIIFVDNEAEESWETMVIVAELSGVPYTRLKPGLHIIVPPRSPVLFEVAVRTCAWVDITSRRIPLMTPDAFAHVRVLPLGEHSGEGPYGMDLGDKGGFAYGSRNQLLELSATSRRQELMIFGEENEGNMLHAQLTYVSPLKLRHRRK